MAIPSQDIESLVARVRRLSLPDVPLSSVRAAIAQAVDRGLLDDLVQEDDLEEWVEERGPAAAAEGEEVAGPILAAYVTFALLCQVLRLLEARDDDEAHVLRGATWRNMGFGWLEAEQVRLALDARLQAAAEFGRVADDLSVARAQVDAADCLQTLGRPHEALALYDQAEPVIHREGEAVDYAACRMNHATCLQEVGRANEAPPLYIEAETIFRAHERWVSVARCHMNHGICLQELGRPEEALPLLEQAERVFREHEEPEDVVIVRMNRATCLHQLDRSEEARELYEAVLREAERLGPALDFIRWQTLYNLAILLYRDPAEIIHAQALAAQVLALIERLAAVPTRFEDRISLRSVYAKTFRLAVDIDLLCSDNLAAFRHAQQAKGRALADVWEEGLRMEQIPRSRLETDLLGGGMQDLGAIAEVLHPAEVLIDCLDLGPGGLALFLVRRDHPLAVHRVEDDNLQRALNDLWPAWERELRRSLARGRYREINPLRDLDRLLIQPFRDQGVLTNGDQLILSPSGRVHGIPWAALWRYDENHRVRSLIQDHPLSTIPTASSLWVLRTRYAALTGPPTMLAAAPYAARRIPEQAAAPLGQSPDAMCLRAGRSGVLPHTGREVREIVELLRRISPASTIVELYRDAATVDALVGAAGGVRLLLIAAHGARIEKSAGVVDFALFFHPRSRSAPTTLTVRQVFDGQLSLRDVFQVALTACDLGSVITHGEEMIGFTQAFLTAGARVCLAPSWPVHDAATADLSIAYHRHLLGHDRPTVREAMQRAMQEIHDTPGYEHPFFWAAFLPAGDSALTLPTTA